MEKPKKEAVSLQTTARVLDVNVTTVRRWIRTGKLRAFRAGPKLLRVSIVELHRLQMSR